MASQKINYGIDLGTTNSAIARMEDGRPVVKRIEVTDSIMPSCVYFNKKRYIVVGASAYRSMLSDRRRATRTDTGATSTFCNFKRLMGTDTALECFNMGRSYSPEELSAEVLKALKLYITDHDVKAAVITVPAKFTVNQKTATIEAAKMAGISHVELLQEPVAATYAYGLSSAEKNGYWMVFDFGGGTFDVALIRVEDGIRQVFDTEGDNHLGGCTLDYAIADKILMPYLADNFAMLGIFADEDRKAVWRDAMTTYAESIKNQLSFRDKAEVTSDLGDLGTDDNGEEVELDIVVSREEYERVARPVYQRAVDMCVELLRRNNLTGDQLSKVILVGGPTHAPLVREMLRTQVCPRLDTSKDPMTVVAEGAAIYASNIDCQLERTDADADEVRLEVSFDAMTVEDIAFVPIGFPGSDDSVMVRVVRSDYTWDSGFMEVDAAGNVFELTLLPDRANTFTIECTDIWGKKLKCFPDSITIIQGSQAGSAPLPYNIALAAYNSDHERDEVVPVSGLEKNKSLPATGTCNNLHTTVALHPGKKDDVLNLPLYQADQGYKPAYLFDLIGVVRITGADIDVFIPKGACVDITVKADRNEQMTVKAYFPDYDLEVENVIDTSRKQKISEAKEYIDRWLPKVRMSIDELEKHGEDVELLRYELEMVEDESAESREHKATMQHLRSLQLRVENARDKTEWDRVEAELLDAFSQLQEADTQVGNEQSRNMLKTMQSQIEGVTRRRDIRMARELTKTINQAYFKLTIAYQARYLIEDADRQFDLIAWKDATLARKLIDTGLRGIRDNVHSDVLRQIAADIIRQLPDTERGRLDSGIGF